MTNQVPKKIANENSKEQSVVTKNSILQYLKSEAGFADIEAKNLLSNFFSVLEEEVVQGSNVKFYGFGTFTAKKKASRKGKNFKTGEQISIPEQKKAHFIRSKKPVLQG